MTALPIPNTLQIKTYCHCALCIKECHGKVAPVDYARLSIGWTVLGLQVWCERHKVNVVNIDFEGHKHPANTSADPLSTIAPKGSA